MKKDRICKVKTQIINLLITFTLIVQLIRYFTPLC